MVDKMAARMAVPRVAVSVMMMVHSLAVELVQSKVVESVAAMVVNSVAL